MFTSLSLTLYSFFAENKDLLHLEMTVMKAASELKTQKIADRKTKTMNRKKAKMLYSQNYSWVMIICGFVATGDSFHIHSHTIITSTSFDTLYNLLI